MRLPPTFIKEVLQSYPMEKRIQLIASRPEQEANKLLNSFAEKETTAREMLDMELETFKSDVTKLGAARSGQEDIWKEFVTFCRHALDKQPQYRSEAHKLLKEWANGLDKGLSAVAQEDVA